MVEAKRCAEAGASIVHVHARTPDGNMSYDCSWYDEVAWRIATETDLIANFTMARFNSAPIESTFAYLRGCRRPPEMIALNCGTIVLNMRQPDGTRRSLQVPNSWDDMVDTAALCRELGILPELAALDSGFLSNIATLQEDGHIEAPQFLLLEFSSRFGDGIQAMVGTPAAYFYAAETVRTRFPGAIWAAHGMEESSFLIGGLAITTGAHVRVGFEDCTTLPTGEQARSNAELVEWAVEVGRLTGRSPASPAQTRGIVGLNKFP